MELDREAVRLRRRAVERKQELVTEQAQALAAEEKAAALAVQLRAFRAKLDMRQLELKSAEGAIARYEAQMMEMKSASDIERMQGQISGKRVELSAAEDRILESMEVTEKGEAGLKDLRAIAAERVQRLATRNDTAAREDAEESARLTAVTKEWESAAAAVGGELLASYRARRDASGGVGAALDNAGFCSACGTRLSPQLMAATRIEKLPECPSCQRMLLPAADSARE